MVPGWAVILSALLYLCLLFAVAHWADTSRRVVMAGPLRSTIYAFSLAVYCTSWTFYGSVGLASHTGLDFLMIYLGPMLMIGLGFPLIARVTRIAKAQNITSIADFVAARYGKSERVAALVCLIAIVGAVPYIALQLKAVSISLETFLAAIEGNSFQTRPPLLGDAELLVALVLAGFSVAFGTRHTDATEHQDGLMVAIALESVVKLLAFLAVGVFVTYAFYGGFGEMLERLASPSNSSRIVETTSDSISLLTLFALSSFAILLLPRQFHMTVVENRQPIDIRRAAWIFPIYLILINLFVIPITQAGLALFPEGEIDRDMTVLALPLSQGSGMVALAAFMGGLSAATAMIIVESVAIAIMISNHLVLPLMLRRRLFGKGDVSVEDEPDLSGFVLGVRRMAIVAVVLLAYAYHRGAGEAALASIGLLSFAAIAQIAPSFLGGLFWARGTALGASAGLTAGFLVWAYTLLLPSLAWEGVIWTSVVTEGPLGIGLLKPTSLLGLELPQLAHGVVWSLGLNLAAYVAFSLLRPASALERLQAKAFVGTAEATIAPSFRFFRATVTVGDLQATVARYLGEDRTRRAFQSFADSRAITFDARREADVHLLRFAEHLLASAIGAASSRLALSLLLRRRNVSSRAALKLLDDASAALQYNRDLLQHAIDHARQGITVVDKEMRLLCWNQAFLDLYDLPADLMRVGTGLDDVIRFNAERGTYGPGQADDQLMQRLESLTQDPDPVRLRLYPSGKVIEIRSNHLPDGGLVTTYTDVTGVVAEEEARARAAETLEQRVRERTEELMRLNEALTRAKAEAEEANVSKTRFLAAASHDILQPLNAARLYATSLVDRDRDLGDPTLAENVDAALDAVEEILTALLDISRLDTGAMRPQWSRFRVDELFRQLQREFEPVAREKGLKLTFMPTSLAVRSDRSLLRRLLQNLVSNAIKYTPSGRVVVGARRRGMQLAIEVWDTGLGIPASKQKLVFREFHRLDQGARVARGLGLGLSIVERIGRVLDHSVSLKSEPGRGSVFRVEVPVVAPEPAEITPIERPRAPATPLAGLRVLAIDNEPTILEGMRTLLTGWGCTVTVAANLRDALETLRAADLIPEAVIADYHLDEGDGLEAVASLRFSLRNEIPAVLLTADRSPALREEAAAQDVHVLNKPLKPAALRALLAQWRASRAAAAE